MSSLERILYRISCLLILTGALCTWVSGCKSRKPAAPSNTIGTVAETPLLEKPPTPTVEPIQQHIKAADAKTDEAIALTKNVPAAAPLQPILAVVKTEHAAAQAETEVTKKQIAAVENVVVKNDQIQDANLTRVKEAADKDAEANQKAIAERDEKIAKLENEELNAAKHRLMLIGVLLLLAGVGSAVAMFTIGFPAGLKVAAICAPMGSVCIVLAINLSKIVFWTEWALFGGAVLAVAYLAWHFFHRDPMAPIHKLTVVRQEKK